MTSRYLCRYHLVRYARCGHKDCTDQRSILANLFAVASVARRYRLATSLNRAPIRRFASGVCTSVETYRRGRSGLPAALPEGYAALVGAGSFRNHCATRFLLGCADSRETCEKSSRPWCLARLSASELPLAASRSFIKIDTAVERALSWIVNLSAREGF